jgi:DNA invertase Pin-like site-specific DNA recombinase
MQESLDTSTAMGRFVVDIIQRLAQLESEQIGERVYIAMKQKAKTVGGPLGGNVPFGYMYRKGILKLNENESEIVKLIFKEYSTGKTTNEIAKILNSKGYLRRNKKNWIKREISKILRNPIYCGFKRWDDVIEESDHPKIIKPSIFNDVQVKILERTKNFPAVYVSLLSEEQ